MLDVGFGVSAGAFEAGSAGAFETVFPGCGETVSEEAFEKREVGNSREVVGVSKMGRGVVAGLLSVLLSCKSSFNLLG